MDRTVTTAQISQAATTVARRFVNRQHDARSFNAVRSYLESGLLAQVAGFNYPMYVARRDNARRVISENPRLDESILRIRAQFDLELDKIS